MVDLSLRGRGPFTVFAPDAEAFGKVSKEVRSDRVWVSERARAPATALIFVVPVCPQMKRMIGMSNTRPSTREKYADILRYHVVSCNALSASDLTTPRNLTTLMGDVLRISSLKVNRRRRDAEPHV